MTSPTHDLKCQAPRADGEIEQEIRESVDLFHMLLMTNYGFTMFNYNRQYSRGYLQYLKYVLATLQAQLEVIK